MFTCKLRLLRIRKWTIYLDAIKLHTLTSKFLFKIKCVHFSKCNILVHLFADLPVNIFIMWVNGEMFRKCQELNTLQLKFVPCAPTKNILILICCSQELVLIIKHISEMCPSGRCCTILGYICGYFRTTEISLPKI